MSIEMRNLKVSRGNANRRLLTSKGDSAIECGGISHRSKRISRWLALRVNFKRMLPISTPHSSKQCIQLVWAASTSRVTDPLARSNVIMFGPAPLETSLVEIVQVSTVPPSKSRYQNMRVPQCTELLKTLLALTRGIYVRPHAPCHGSARS